MSKHAKHKPVAAPTAPTNLDLAEKAARLAIVTLEAAIEGGDTAPQTTRELGGAVRALMAVESERRAQTKAKVFTAKTLPRELLMEALRAMPQDERNHIRRELDAMDNTESVLG
jgi:hypothetical protein